MPASPLHAPCPASKNMIFCTINFGVECAYAVATVSSEQATVWRYRECILARCFRCVFANRLMAQKITSIIAYMRKMCMKFCIFRWCCCSVFIFSCRLAWCESVYFSFNVFIFRGSLFPLQNADALAVVYRRRYFFFRFRKLFFI